MPKIESKIAQIKEHEGVTYAIIPLNRVKPKKGEKCSLKWGSVRSLPQNSLYWKYLNWCITEGGLEDYGHFDPQALHQDLKAHFISEKIFDKGQFKAIEEGTTTQMTKTEFGEYMDKVDGFMNGFFKLNTAPFWEQYEENYT